MNFFLLIIFLQIFLESFPVSSSGHITLIEKLFAFNTKNILPAFFNHFLHGPTILIIMFLFLKDWIYPAKKLLHGFFDKNFRKKDSYKKLLKIFFKLVGYLFVICVIANLFWIPIEFKFEKMNWFYSNTVLLVGFILTFCLFIILYLKNLRSNKNIEVLNLKKVIILGIVQGLALFPGISRFASVYVVSRFLNLSPRRSFQITFLIQLPLVFAGFFLGFFDLILFMGRSASCVALCEAGSLPAVEVKAAFCLPKLYGGQVAEFFGEGLTSEFKNFFNFKIFFIIFISTILSFFAFYWVQQLALKKKLWRFGFYMLLPIALLVWVMIS